MPEERRGALGDTVLISMNVIGIISFLTFMLVFYLFHRFTGNHFPFFPYAILTFLQLYLSNNVSFYLTKLRILRQAKQYARFSIVQCIVTNALILILVVYYKEGASGKLYAAAAATLLFSVYSFLRSIERFRVDKTILCEALKFGAPLTLSALFWYCLTGVDRLMLERLGEIEQLGIYNVGLVIAGYMQIFYTTLSNTFEPDIYQSIEQSNRRRLYAIIGIIVGVVSVVNILFIVAAPYVIDILTAGRYVSSAPYARIFALHNITMACYYMVVRLLVGYGYVKGELLVRVVGAALSVACFYLLIQNYGFSGAAWGQVLSFALLSIIGLLYFRVKRRC